MHGIILNPIKLTDLTPTLPSSLSLWFRLILQYGSNNNDPQPPPSSSSSTTNDTTNTNRVQTVIRTVETGMLTSLHLSQTALYLVQVALSYLLMLVFMTYNSWLCLATLLGITSGYFVFGWRKNVMVEQSDVCCS